MRLIHLMVWLTRDLNEGLKAILKGNQLTFKLPDKLQPYGLYVYYVVHICDFGMLRVNVYMFCYLCGLITCFSTKC